MDAGTYKRLNVYKALQALTSTYFALNDAGDMICGFKNNKISPHNLVIPDVINGTTVTAISDRAFYGCTTLQSIEIPASVSAIGWAAFGMCPSLESITVASENKAYSGEGDCLIALANNESIAGCGTSCVPDWVQRIGVYAFAGSGVREIELPESVVHIGEGAFYECASLTNIGMPPLVNYISKKTFYGCGSLAEITLPRCLFIDDWAFYGCGSLTNVVIPQGVLSVGNYAFYGCEALQSVMMQPGLIGIQTGAFAECYNLQYVHIPDTVCEIWSDAFARCYRLKSIALPDSITTVEGGAFVDCRSLESVVLPERLGGLDSLFGGCERLKAVYLTRRATDESELLPILCLPNALFDETVEYIFVPDEETAALYRYADGWSDYEEKICAYIDGELPQNWVLISYADYSEIDWGSVDINDDAYADVPLRDLFACGFKAVYALSQTEDAYTAWEEIREIVWENYDAQFLLYLTDAMLKEGVTEDWLYTTCLDGVTAIIATDTAAHYVSRERFPFCAIPTVWDITWRAPTRTKR